MIPLFIVDDQPAVLAGLRMMLALEADMQVLGEAGDGRSAIDIVSRLKPDVVIMDIKMPIMDGLAATRVLRPLAPESQVIILTIYDNKSMQRQVHQAGGSCLVPKHVGPTALLHAIRAVCKQ